MQLKVGVQTHLTDAKFRGELSLFDLEIQEKVHMKIGVLSWINLRENYVRF